MSPAKGLSSNFNAYTLWQHFDNSDKAAFLFILYRILMLLPLLIISLTFCELSKYFTPTLFKNRGHIDSRNL